ncbi:MAG: bifunctional UDP-N-acetylglucosamine diphosphorylase/glucosamine-1-phosphate N-acetyltransferase GlmU [Burkholderiales bacterium]|nr:bifunctional UDP-N-acetylglucosamine diphosphorylase/glucosamine-1-phosphate N-acetyltransferase GlmU [Burkholderiales bacterium]
MTHSTSTHPASDSPTSGRRCLAVILAAGEGTRMKSALPKVLHPVAGRPMVSHVIDAVTRAGADRVVVVVGPGRDDVAAEAKRVCADVAIAVQVERLGTGHAVLAARAVIAEGFDDVVVVFGDTPLVEPETLARMRRGVADGAAVVALGFEAADPTGYGRFIVEGDVLVAIREHKDASPAERAVRLCNAGLMALDGRSALDVLGAIGNDNAAREYYLTDAVAVAAARGLRASAMTAPEAEVMGINDRVQLAQAEAIMQGRLRRRAMRAGVSMIGPETVFMSFDTALGQDVVVEPHVVFGPGVTVEGPAVIHAFSHLEGARVAAGASVGPYARLRPGAVLGPKAKVGNFVEIKNAELGVGAKVNHLSYVGDATVGGGANLGAGTITCNYDGFGKYRTVIGDNAFVGSNSALVAPVTIGAGAYVGSGSVVTKDVPADALAIARGRQMTREGWAVSFRASKSKARTS